MNLLFRYSELFVNFFFFLICLSSLDLVPVVFFNLDFRLSVKYMLYDFFFKCVFQLYYEIFSFWFWLYLIFWFLLYSNKDIFSLFFVPELFFFFSLFVIFFKLLSDVFINSEVFNTGWVSSIKTSSKKFNSFNFFFLKKLINNCVSNYLIRESFYMGCLLFLIMVFLCTKQSSTFSDCFFYLNGFCILDWQLLVLKIWIIFFFILILCLCKTQFINLSLLKSDIWLVWGFSVWALLVILSAYNFILFYLCLELFSFSILILISVVNHEAVKRSSSLKYFSLNSFASMLILFGIVIFYGLLGTFSYKLISLIYLFDLNDSVNYILYFQSKVALFLILCGLFIKIGVVPFHFWLIDLYENISFSFLAYILVCSKILIFYCLFCLSQLIFISLIWFSSSIFIVIGFVSMLVGSVGAYNQITIKRFVIFSSLFNSGSLFICLSIGTHFSEYLFLNYLVWDCFFFLLMIIAFGLLVDVKLTETSRPSHIYCLSFIQDFKIKAILSLLFLVLTGIPPFGLFFFKYLILQSLVMSPEGVVSVFFFLLFTALNAFNYLRLIKVMWFFQKQILLSINEGVLNKVLNVNIVEYTWFKDLFLIFMVIFGTFLGFFFLYFFWNFFFLFYN